MYLQQIEDHFRKSNMGNRCVITPICHFHKKVYHISHYLKGNLRMCQSQLYSLAFNTSKTFRIHFCCNKTSHQCPANIKEMGNSPHYNSCNTLFFSRIGQDRTSP